MSAQLIALFMFLLLTYLLFSRPGSAAAGRAGRRQGPTELNCQIRRPVHSKKGLREKAAIAAPDRRAAMLRGSARVLVLGLAFTTAAIAQPPTTQSQLASTGSEIKAAKEDKKESKVTKDNEVLLEEMNRMRQLIERLEARVNQLETEKGAVNPSPAIAGTRRTGAIAASEGSTSQAQTPVLSADDRGVLDFFRDTTVNMTIDGYYGYNFNRPVGGINLLRAYDPTSNSFNLSQAAIINSTTTKDLPSGKPPTAPSKPPWQYGGFIDLGYLLDFNHPANRIFRSRGTAWHVDRVHLNMAGAYLKKQASEASRWGVELTAQAGKDTEVFGFSATAPNLGGYKFLRHLGPTNVSYLAPVGKGLNLQGGIFTSLIGYDSLYAQDNFEYTRPWGADFTPYFMLGVNASYPFSEKLTGTFFVVNGYWHLANANSVPSAGGQLAYKASPHVTVKETVLFGPHQSNTSFKFWRFLTDTIVERKTERVTFAFEYIASTERVDAPGHPRALMMSGQLPVHWAINKHWSATVRPEVFWDRDGRWTLARQTVKAVTTTLEYRIPYQKTNTILRLEHRYDDSRGPEGGFFRGAELRPGVVGLTPTQHLLTFGLIFTFDR